MSRFNQQGFTFLTVVFAVVMIGISLSVVGQQWRTVVQREREEELLYRGDQIKHAIQAYYLDSSAPPPGSGIAPKVGVALYPSCGVEGNDCFKDLLGDPESHKKRYLRKAYKDPITNDEWLMIRAPGNRLMGVHSKSLKEPFKKANFPEEYKCFEQATAYFDWAFQFIAVASQPVAQGTAPGQPPAPVAVQEQPCTIPPRPDQDKDKDKDKNK